MKLDNPTIDFTFDRMVEMLDKKQTFSFSRWGDGEMQCMWNSDVGHNCDGHKYLPNLSKALKFAVERPNHIYGLQSLGYSQFKDKIDSLNNKWADADIMHRASLEGNLDKLFKVLDKRNVIMVAPKHIKKINSRFHYMGFCEVSDKNCFEDDILTNLKKRVYQQLDKDIVILFCASMATNVWMHEMAFYFGGIITMIDAGSVFDPYCGVKSRSYHHKL